MASSSVPNFLPDDRQLPRTTKIGISTAGEDLAKAAQQLADRLALPLITGSETEYDLVLKLCSDRLAAFMPHEPTLTKPVWVEFTEGSFGYRRRHGGSELLLRAMGIKKDYRPLVLDATAGWGRDGFLLAAAGCQVIMHERNPVVAALLADGLRRAADHSQTIDIAQRIKLIEGNSTAFLQKYEHDNEQVDVVYLDPMFPTRTKSAKVKKELQLLQLLLGPDHDATALFHLALRTARRRVVVKRPLTAPPLTERQPSHSLTGKSTRFDVYLAVR